jgi:GAF domain-containing protein/HAMP domain-containing protein
MLFGIRWGSLRAKIIAWSFVPTAIILGTVALLTFFAYQQVTEELVLERNQELTRLSASQLNTEMKAYANLLAAEARRAEYQGADRAALQATLKEAMNRLSVFDAGVLVLDEFGAIIATEPGRPELLDHNWSDRTYYRQVLRSLMLGSPSAVLSDIVPDGLGGAEAVAVAVPVTGPQGEFGGLIVGMFRVDAFSTSALFGNIVKLRIGENDSAYIVDGNGRLVYHSDPERIGSSASDQQVVRQVLDGQTGAVRSRDTQGADIVASFAPIPGTTWGLIREEKWGDLLHSSQRYGGFLILLLALGLIVPAVVVAIGVRRLTRPISDLIEGAREVANGNFGRSIVADTGDEIEDLADQFNLMSAQLQESYANLEHRVTVRTRELAALNAIAAVVSQTLELDEMLCGALETTLQVTEADAGGIYLLDERARLLTIAAHHGFSPEFVAGIDRLDVGEGFSGSVVQSGQPLLVRSVADDPRLTREVVRQEGIQSLVTVPLSSKGKVQGTLFAVSHGSQQFSDQDLQLLTSIGQQIGVAVEGARLFQQERRRAEEFQVISEVGHQITSILDIDAVLIQLVRLVQASFHYDHVGIALIEKDEVVYKVGAGVLWDNPQFDFHPRRLKIGSEGITGWVAASGEPLLVPDVDQEPRYVQMKDSQTQSELAVPIMVKGQVIGVLDVQSDHLNAFDESDLAVLQSLANQAAVAIENARLFEAEQRRAEQFRVISEVGRQLTTIMDIDDMLHRMAKLIQQAFGYYHVGIGLVEGAWVISRAEVGAATKAYTGARLRIGQEGVWGSVAHTGESLLVADARAEPRFSPVPKAAQIQSQVCVPLKTKEAVIGVLSAESNRLNAFDESDVVVLQSLAQQAAFAIENARFFRDISRQVRELRALTDASRIISSVLDQDRLLEALYEQITQIAPTDFYLIALYDEPTNVVSIEINVDEGIRFPKEQYILDKGLLTLVIRARKCIRFDSLSEEKGDLDVETVPTGSPKANEAWLGVPMLYGDRVLGAIIVGSYQRAVFDEGHEQILTTIANQAAVALENARLYEQAQQLAVMEERQRLARELHDAVTQTLFSASLIAEALPDLWSLDQDEGKELLTELRQLNRGALAEMRTLLLELRPAALAEASLDDLLRQLGDATTGRSGVPVNLFVEGQIDLPAEVHVTLYRIAQEAMNNVVKHAGPCQVEVRLRRTLVEAADAGQSEIRAELEVIDDGCGFDRSTIPPDRLGLGIIRERVHAIGATLSLQSQPGHGTRIAVTWQQASPSRDADGP